MNVTSSGLRVLDIQLIHNALRQYPRVTEAILYGSRAKGNYRPGSDIDLTLRGDQLSHNDLLDIEQSLDDLLLPYKIDLSLLDQIDNPELLKHIERVGQSFYLNTAGSRQVAG
ncbi:nucleotidyltransferase domain-containing protein [Stutzerimonas chloritidismutans]|uniref:nucleotidyltransferase domain-containing protein n=1 Tax=Stutzerimonas chloritidismutans TaxID=203192 RepID=UPI00384E7365